MPNNIDFKKAYKMFRNSKDVGKVLEWLGRQTKFSNPPDGYRDITSAIAVRGVGANDPTWSLVGGGPLRAYKFAINDECWMSFHIPHDITLNTDVFFHVHWFANGTNANTVKWQFEYAYAKGHNQSAFPIGSESTVTAEQASPAQWQHMVTETDAVSIPGIEVDGIIYCKITRIANGGTDNADDIFVVEVDLHYLSDNQGTLNRAPNFYEPSRFKV